MHYHYINDNEDRFGKKHWAKTGRIYFYFTEKRRKEICFSWSLFAHFCAIGFDIDDEGWTFRICIPYIISLWLTLTGFKFLNKIEPKRKCIATWDNNREFELTDERECELNFHDWILWIKPWSKKNEWCRSDPWYVRGLTFHLDDFLFGKQKFKEEIIQEKRPIIVPMPEGQYEANFSIEKRTWWKARLPFWKTICYYVNVDVPKGIPHNGKGENSWDCGIDGLMGTSFKIDNLFEAESKAVTGVIESVMKSRKKYGTPSEKEIRDWRGENILFEGE